MDLLAPVLNLGNDLATIWRQQRHPVYNAAGQVVGSYDTLDALCQGQWFLDKGAVQPPASQLYVVDFWGTRVPLATQCVRSATANAGDSGSVVFPQAVQPASAAAAQAAANLAETGAAETPSLADLADLAGPVIDQANLQKWETYALWGFVGLLGVLALKGGRSSGRR